MAPSTPGSGRAAADDPTGWRGRSPSTVSSSRSSASDRKVGPCRPVSASRRAAATAPGTSSAVIGSAADFARPPIVVTRSISWNASRPRSRLATWPAMAMTGDESDRAVWIPMARLAAPTALVPRHRAGRPVSWPTASAMNAAPPSWRVPTTRMPAAGRASSNPRKLSPGTVNAQRTPPAWSCSAMSRPTVMGSAGADGASSGAVRDDESGAASTSRSARLRRPPRWSSLDRRRVPGLVRSGAWGGSSGAWGGSSGAWGGSSGAWGGSSGAWGGSSGAWGGSSGAWGGSSGAWGGSSGAWGGSSGAWGGSSGAWGGSSGASARPTCSSPVASSLGRAGMSSIMSSLRRRDGREDEAEDDDDRDHGHDHPRPTFSCHRRGSSSSGS